MKTIEINGEEYSYEARNGFTEIIDSDGNCFLRLPLKATHVAVECAIRAFECGFKRGKEAGAHQKLIQIQQALGIPQTPLEP